MSTIQYSENVKADEKIYIIQSQKTDSAKSYFIFFQYGLAVFSGMPKYVKKRLQKVFNAAAGFVWNKYANIDKCIKLSWLPMQEEIEYNFLSLAYKGLNDPHFPKNMKVELKQKTRNLRNNNDGPMITCSDNFTSFQSEAKLYFNGLLRPIRDKTTSSSFKNGVCHNLFDRAAAKLISDQTLDLRREKKINK